jgi:hypothetical protein
MDLYSHVDCSPWMRGKIPDLTPKVTVDRVQPSVSNDCLTKLYWRISELGCLDPAVALDVQSWFTWRNLRAPDDFGDITKWTGFVEVWHRGE